MQEKKPSSKFSETMTKSIKAIGAFLKRLGKSTSEVFSETPRKIAAIIIGFNGLLQLGISNIHIMSLVTIKATVNTPGKLNYTAGIASDGIGLFFFLFILFGLVSVFAATRVKNNKTVYFVISTILITLASGTVYLLKLTNPDNYISFARILPSIILMGVGFIMNIASIIVYIYQIILFKKNIGVVNEVD